MMKLQTTQADFHHSDFIRPATRAASAVGLLGSPLGQGPLLEASMLFLERKRITPPRWDGLAALAPEFSPDIAPGDWPRNRPESRGSDISGETGLGIGAVLLVVGILASVGVAISRAAKKPAAVGRVRIVALPPGEAPEEIRRAWIGLEFPVTSCPEGHSEGVYGVLSNRPAGCCDGYEVEGAEAVRILATKAPGAAAWWRSHAPHVLTCGYQLVFPAEVCEPIS
jgi:hypothetical protein